MGDKEKMSDKVDALIGVVVLLMLIGALAPVALPALFNTTAFTGVPAWVPTALGTLGAIGFVYIIWKGAKGG